MQQPLFTQNYTLSMESFLAFTKMQNQAALQKSEKNLKTLAGFQMFVGIGFLFIIFVGQEKINLFLVLLGLMAFGFGAYGFCNLKNIQNKIVPTIEKNYFARNYDQYAFQVAFFEEELVYQFHDQKGSMEYYNLMKVWEDEEYLALSFNTGETIIFDKTCDFRQILNIVQKNLGVDAK